MAVNGEQNQQYNQNADEKEQTPATGGGAPNSPGSAGGSASSGRVANYSSGTQAGASGSGRFTNLQKYIGANQGAGDRLASGITNKVERSNEPASKEAQTSAGAVREGIQSAQNKLQTGNQYKEQLDSDSFNAKDIAGDQNKLQEFGQYRTGSAIDEAMLAKQNQAAQTNYANLQNQMQQQLGQTQNDTGRYQLLKNTFGGGSVYQNPYSQGQQRLDQLFLQSGGNNGIGQLQNTLRSGVNSAGNQLNELSGAVSGNINDIASREAALASGLQSGIDAKTGKYVSDIEATQDQVNAQRKAEQDWANKQYAALQSGQGIDQRFAQMLGLNQGQHLYNTLSDKNVNNFFNYGAAELNGADQLANQDQRQYYDALAQLSGMDKNAYAINQGTNPSAAVSAIENSWQPINQLSSDMTTNLSGQTGYGAAANHVVAANGNVNMGNLISAIDSQGNSQELYDTLRGANADAITKYLNGGDANLAAEGMTLDPQVKAVLNQLNTLQGAITANNATSNVDAQLAGYTARAKANAYMNALNQLNDENFFRTVRINPGSDVESGGQFGVS